MIVLMRLCSFAPIALFSPKVTAIPPFARMYFYRALPIGGGVLSYCRKISDAYYTKTRNAWHQA